MVRYAAAVVAVEAGPDASVLAARGLRALRHPGDAVGLAVIGPAGWTARRGLRSADLADEPGWRLLGAGAAVGAAWRQGGDDWQDPARRPAVAATAVGSIAVACVGGLVNRDERVQAVLQGGGALHDDTDSELVLQLIARSAQRTLVNRVVDVAWTLRGAVGLVVASPERVVALRDAHGLARLVVGQVGEAHAVASDEAALVAMGALRWRELSPEELVVLEGRHATSVFPLPRRPAARCAVAAFGLASSVLSPASATTLREAAGRALARSEPSPPDAVVVAADARSLPVASGLAEASSLRMLPVLGSAAPVDGRAVVLACALPPAPELVPALLAAGAREVHVRVAAPVLAHACPYGVLVEGASRAPAAASTAHLDVATAREVLGEGWCWGCTTGEAPVPPDGDVQLPLFTG